MMFPPMGPAVTILRGEIYVVRLPRSRKRKPTMDQVAPRNPVWFDLRRRKRA